MSHGIKSQSHPFITEQAARELYVICTHEPTLRKKIFTEIVEHGRESVLSLSASRLLCDTVEEKLKDLLGKEIDVQLNSIRQLEKGKKYVFIAKKFNIATVHMNQRKNPKALH